jgi:hypothetical protein
MCYGTLWQIPAADRLFTEHTTPQWMLDPEIYSTLKMINANCFPRNAHLRLLTLGLATQGFKRVLDDNECEADYKRVISAREHAVVIDDEKTIHEDVMRIASNCAKQRHFCVRSSLHNPPQIRDFELH